MAAWALLPFVVLAPSLCCGQTVTYSTQTGNFNALQTERNNGPPYAGTYNNGDGTRPVRQWRLVRQYPRGRRV